MDAHGTGREDELGLPDDDDAAVDDPGDARPQDRRDHDDDEGQARPENRHERDRQEERREREHGVGDAHEDGLHGDRDARRLAAPPPEDDP